MEMGQQCRWVFLNSRMQKLLTRYAAPFYPFKWVKGVPRKVSIHGWKAIQDRLPILVGLKKRNITHGSTACKLCGEGEENADHLFTSCVVASIVWNKISSWLGVHPIYALCVKDLLELHNIINTSKEKRALIRIIILAACSRVNASCIFGEVQVLAFTWVKYKCRQLGWTWESWRAFNVPIT